VRKFCDVVGLQLADGRTFTYDEIAKGKLKSISLGRKRVIDSNDAETWFASYRNAPEPMAA
jgi:hypothetical protein